MKKKRDTNERSMTTTEYLDHLTTEERRSRLLAEIEQDPKKRQREQEKNRRLKKLIERVKIAASGGIETADARDQVETADGSKLGKAVLEQN